MSSRPPFIWMANMQRIKCLNNHYPIEMALINQSDYRFPYRYYWYQCPHCSKKKLLTSDGIFEEEAGKDWIESKKKEESEKARIFEDIQRKAQKQKEEAERRQREIWEKQRIAEQREREKDHLNEMENKQKKWKISLLFAFIWSISLFLLSLAWNFLEYKFLSCIGFVLGGIFGIGFSWDKVDLIKIEIRDIKYIKIKAIEAKEIKEQLERLIKSFMKNYFYLNITLAIITLLIGILPIGGNRIIGYVCSSFFFLTAIWNFAYMLYSRIRYGEKW